MTKRSSTTSVSDCGVARVAARRILSAFASATDRLTGRSNSPFAHTVAHRFIQPMQAPSPRYAERRRWFAYVHACISTVICLSLLPACKQRHTEDREISRSVSANPEPGSSDPKLSATAPVETSKPVGSRPAIRESKRLVIDGVEETWSLEWMSAPQPACRDAVIACPCEGFAYAERGKLDLVRSRDGSPFERMNLSELFLDSVAILPRWTPLLDEAESELSDEALASRPVLGILKFGDYDRDGRATEFPLQVRATSCHTQTLLIGVSKARPSLHAIGSKEAPNVGLVLEHFSDWQKVLEAPDTTLHQWACGDHGAPREVSVRIRAAGGELSAKTLVRDCSGE
jgi:hypothetical protein